MKDNKGQALVEFVLIIPVIILIILSVVDFSNIISHKYTLENDLDVIVDFYNNGKNNEINEYVNNHEEILSYEYDDEFITVKLSRNVKVVTPLLNNILGKNYRVTASRSILKGEKNENQ